MASNTIPTSITQYQTGFAPEIAPYAQNMLGAAQGTVFQYQKDADNKNVLDEQGMPIISGFQPYQSYPTEDRFAQFNPLQQRAFSGAENMLPSQTTAGASQLAGLAGLGALGTSYSPTNFSSQYVSQDKAPPLVPYTPLFIPITLSNPKFSISGGNTITKFRSIDSAFKYARTASADFDVCPKDAAVDNIMRYIVFDGVSA